MSKFAAKKTRKVSPVRVVVHGPPGVGKSTFGASAPDAIFIAAEDGLEEIDALAVEPHPKTYEDVLEALDYVATLDRKTVVIDSLDWLEPLVWDYAVRMARSSKIRTIEDFGFKAGYIVALDYWRVLIKRLEALRERGMHVILIAHSIRRTFKNPLGDDYEQFTIKLHEKATALFVEWARIIGYCDFDIATVGTETRAKAIATGRRVLRVLPNPAYLAKSRTVNPLPDPLPFAHEGGWDAFAGALAAADGEEHAPAPVRKARVTDPTIAALKSEFEVRIAAIADAGVEKKARGFLKINGTTAETLREAIETLDLTLEERKAS